EITSTSGIDNPRWATAASFFDFDRDGWLDIVIANYVDYSPTQKCFDAAGVQEYCGPQNFEGTVTRLFRNLGVASGDVRFEDVTVPHLAPAEHAPWVQGPRGFFQDKTAELGLTNAGWRGTGFGTVLADFDLDGQLDLAFVNGLVRRGHDPAPRVEGLQPMLS